MIWIKVKDPTGGGFIDMEDRKKLPCGALAWVDREACYPAYRCEDCGAIEGSMGVPKRCKELEIEAHNKEGVSKITDAARRVIDTIEEESVDLPSTQQIINVLEDGKALQFFGITDQGAVEEAHDYLVRQESRSRAAHDRGKK